MHRACGQTNALPMPLTSFIHPPPLDPSPTFPPSFLPAAILILRPLPSAPLPLPRRHFPRHTACISPTSLPHCPTESSSLAPACTAAAPAALLSRRAASALLRRLRTRSRRPCCRVRRRHLASVAEPLQWLRAACNLYRERDKSLSESVARGVPCQINSFHWTLSY